MAYNPEHFIATNKSYGMGQRGPTDARSWYLDEATLTTRPFNTIAEANAYITGPAREGHTPVYIKDANNVVHEYWWRDNTTDAGLVEKLSQMPVTDNVTTMQAIQAPSTVLFNKDKRRGGRFTLLFDNTIVPDNGITFAATGIGTGFIWQRDIQEARRYNVMWWGAMADSVTDDTAAFEACALYIKTQQTTNSTTRSTNNAIMYLPSGKEYIYNGIGLTIAGAFTIEGDGASQTRIKVISDSYFIDESTNTRSFRVHGLQCAGGKGFYRNRFTANIAGNSVCYKIFDYCTFVDYSVCAISSNSGDDPFFAIRNCKFTGLEGSKAVFINGGTGSYVEHCWFNRGRYYIHLRGASGVTVHHCSFNGLAGTIAKVDIWVEPKANSNVVFMYGEGLHIYDNIHGNEGDRTGDIFYLFAISDTSGNPNHATAPDYGSYPALLEQADPSLYRINAVVFENNNLNSDSQTQQGVVTSYIENVSQCIVRNIIWDNSSKYLFEFPAITKFGDYNTYIKSNYIDVSNMGTRPKPPKLCNIAGFGRLRDPNNFFSGSRAAYPLGDVYDHQYLNLCNPENSLTTIAGTSTITPTTAPDGTNHAWAVHATATEGRVGQQLDLTNAVIGVPIWVEFDVKAGDVNNAGNLTVRLANAVAYTTVFTSWQFDTPDPGTGWKHFTGTVVMPEMTNRALQLFIAVNKYSDPGQTDFKIGCIKVYQARTMQQFPDGQWALKAPAVAGDFTDVVVSDVNNKLRKVSKSNFVPNPPPRFVQTAGAFNTQSITPVPVDFLLIALEANKKYQVTILIKTGCTAVNGLFFGLSAPAGATNEGQNIFSAGSNTAPNISSVPAFGSVTGIATNKFAGQTGTTTMTALVQMGSTAGNLQVIIAAANAADTCTVRQGSYIIAQEVLLAGS